MKIQNEDGTLTFVSAKSAEGKKELEKRVGSKKAAEEKAKKAKK